MTDTGTIPNDAVISRTPGHFATQWDREVILLSADSGMYYHFVGAGTSIWNKLERPLPFAELCDALAREFEVDLGLCQTDTAAFLKKLAKENLVHIEAAQQSA